MLGEASEVANMLALVAPRRPQGDGVVFAVSLRNVLCAPGPRAIRSLLDLLPHCQVSRVADPVAGTPRYFKEFLDVFGVFLIVRAAV